jgi:putative glycosyltransferase (TIGR04372 family)
MKPISRSTHLDGLRGIASAMVFFNHLALAVLPSISTVSPDASGLPVLILIGLSPVSVIWGGDLGVCIFFILSGYVLANFCQTSGLSFPAMVARRYLRLAFPMVFSTVLAFAILKAGMFYNKDAAVISHSPWFALWYQMPPSLSDAVFEGLLRAFTTGKSAYNSNLWTMRLELVGSIAIFLLYALVFRRLVRVPVLMALIWFLPDYYKLFAIGSLLFDLMRQPDPASGDHDFRISSEIGTVSLFAFGILAGGFPASGTQTGISSHWHRWLIDSDNAQAWHNLGASLIMFAVLRSTFLAAALRSRPCQFLGRVSFPLYLIQIPLFCSFTAFLMVSLHLQQYPLWALLVAIGTISVTLPLAWLVAAFVETPSLWFSRRFGQLIEIIWQFFRSFLVVRAGVSLMPLAETGHGTMGDEAVELWAAQDETDAVDLSPVAKAENTAIDLFNDGHFRKVRRTLEDTARVHELTPPGKCLLALAHLIGGNERRAAIFLRQAANEDSFYWRSDLDIQNAGTSGIPSMNDTRFGEDGLLYAGYNLAAMRAFQAGAGGLSARLATKAVAKQDNLKRLAKPSPGLSAFLGQHNLDIDSIRILPANWVSQIGHIGMLDIMLRMRALGWWTGKALVLAPRGSVANEYFLSLVVAQPDVVLLQEESDSELMRELESLIRTHGLTYHVFQPPGLGHVRWHEAAALAMYSHARKMEKGALALAFDEKFSNDPPFKEAFQSAMSAWGITRNDWYVCLHIRELGYHDQNVDLGNANRNSELQNYLTAIEFVVSRGGRVIKMGSHRAPHAPALPGLIDYAHGEFKSEAMDIALIRHARFFIGTTSGLANVAISLGIPTAQVNCITTEFQPWTSSVRFAFKPVKDRKAELLTLSALTSNKRWALATTQTMAHSGMTSAENHAEEILATVVEVDALSRGMPASSEAIAKWREMLSVPHAFGGSLPAAGVYFHDRIGCDLARRLG